MRTTLILLTLAMVACSDSSEAPPVTPPAMLNSSQVILESPPVEVIFGRMGSWSFGVEGDSTTIVFSHSGEEDDISLVVPVLSENTAAPDSDVSQTATSPVLRQLVA